MKLVSYEKDGSAGLGVAVDGAVLATPWPSLDALLAEPDPLAAVTATRLDAAAVIEPDRILAPVATRPQIVATGGNYLDHLDESKTVIELAEPIFVAALWSAVIGPEDEIVLPSGQAQVDYEVELAVVIGKEARGLTPENAMDHVLGFTVVNDVSAREVMIREPFQLMLSKSPDTFLPVGPHLITRDEILDPHALEVSSRLNGEIRQRALTSSMQVPIPDLLSTLTATVTLYPGAIVTTGTPGGVGLFRDPPEFMRDGDVITVAVEGVGRLSNRVVAGW